MRTVYRETSEELVDDSTQFESSHDHIRACRTGYPDEHRIRRTYIHYPNGVLVVKEEKEPAS